MTDPALSRTRSKIGFIGCGALTKAVVAGLCRLSPHGHQILLSPRSEFVSRSLAGEFANVTRLASNQEVVEASDIVFLAVRPQQVDEALAGLKFRSGQIVASFLAKTSCDDLRARIGSTPEICRITPLPSIALGRGPIIFFPRIEEVVQTFAGLGDPVFATSEAEIMTLGYASGTLSTYFEIQNTMIDWLAHHGAQPDHAALYVRSMLEGLAAAGKATPDDDLHRLPAEHETKAGLNERSRRRLAELGWFDQIRKTLDMLDQNTVLAPAASANDAARKP